MIMKINKYKVSQELMNDIDEWKPTGGFVGALNLDIDVDLNDSVYDWWIGDCIPNSESNNRLIALIRYVNGEDVFKVEKPKKWAVHSKIRPYDSASTFEFDTKKEAEKWANQLMEVVEWEVEDD